MDGIEEGWKGGIKEERKRGKKDRKKVKQRTSCVGLRKTQLGPDGGGLFCSDAMSQGIEVSFLMYW